MFPTWASYDFGEVGNTRLRARSEGARNLVITDRVMGSGLAASQRPGMTSMEPKVRTTSLEATLSIGRRLWIYQRERFPVLRTALLLAVFTAASINVSAHLAGRPLPGWGSYAVAFLVALTFFFQLRACDEIKDAEDDRRYRPERPIPRGLVSLRLIVGIGIAAVPIATAATAVLDLRLLGPLALVWLWLALMTAEFFVPAWLKARPFLYLVSHMLIMPLIDFFVTGCEWLKVGGGPPA